MNLCAIPLDLRFGDTILLRNGIEVAIAGPPYIEDDKVHVHINMGARMWYKHDGSHWDSDAYDCLAVAYTSVLFERTYLTKEERLEMRPRIEAVVDFDGSGGVTTVGVSKWTVIDLLDAADQADQALSLLNEAIYAVDMVAEHPRVFERERPHFVDLRHRILAHTTKYHVPYVFQKEPL